MLNFSASTNLLKLQFIFSCCIFFLVSVTSNYIYGQSISDNVLSEEFLAGLPASVRDEIEVKNSVNEEIELENLFRSETSLDKNKIILQKIKKQVSALEKRVSGDLDDASNVLPIFGQNFFSTLQSSFMPVNVPNLGADYLVDVGDSFTLLTTGKINKEYELMVQRDGSLVIPDFGKAIVAGSSLKQAEESVERLIASASVGITSHLVLSKIRDVQVLLLGGIENPGIYTLSGGSSVLSALNVAGGISENGSYRRIELRRGGETIQFIDLYDIFVFGYYEPSSSLRSGDTIFIHPLSFRVPVSGGVNYSAIFEALPGETPEDLIKYASGFSETFSGFDNVMISRVDLSEKSYVTLSKNSLQEFKLKPRDSIMVPSFQSDLEPIKEVVLEGMVDRPGKYLISEGETLSSVIRRAGGYKEDAYIFGGALFRNDALEKEKIFAQLNYADTVNYIVSNIGKPNRNISTSAIDLLVEELRSANYSGRVVSEFNLQKLDSDPKFNPVLQDQDRIVIPSLQKVVYLFGDFRNASNVSYDSTLKIHDYVDLVGGVKKSADKTILVIDPNGITHIYNHGNLFGSNSIEIYPGSIIYAPRDVGKLSGVLYASTISPILSSLALTLASLNSISD